MEDRYRAYGIPSSYDRDPRLSYPGYHPPEGSVASYYSSRPSVLPSGPDVLRNNVAWQPRAYGLDAPAGVINPALPGQSGLPAGITARVPSPLEDPPLAGLNGLASAMAPGPSPLEEPAVVARSSSLGHGAGVPKVEHHSPLPNLDGPSDDESNILFVDGLPTDCTRREVAHLFRPFIGFKDIRVVHKEPRRGTNLMTGSPLRFLTSNSQGSLSARLTPRMVTVFGHRRASSLVYVVGTVDVS
ncbi:hypothetical protein BS78_10G041500 [Paspalum vaginatum]|nr:hypothetical protein BS78_10G041500 [Paspalum vaginatum]